MRTIEEIITAAGGARAISEASGPTDDAGKRPLTYDAVYKWSKIGVPDRHWQLLISMAQSNPDELYAANKKARGSAEVSV